MNRERRNIMLGTAGHVDHGKTAVVKLLTGCDTDTLAEEQERGLTIDLGFAPCRLADERIVGVVDVPGHVDFIRNMVAGAQGIDIVILVVAADDGIMPQTQEHLDILTLMGLRQGLVALTKIDLVPGERQEQVTQHLRKLLKGTFLEPAPVCPLSTLTGEGFEAFFDALNRVVQNCADRPVGGRFRLWVEDVFSIHGTGTVITGIPSAGCVRPGNALQLLPSGLTGRVRRMQVYGNDATEGRAGECVALNIPELHHDQVGRGRVLAEPDDVPPVTIFEAELRLLPTLTNPVPDYLEAHLHVGTAVAPARVALLETPRMCGGEHQMVQLRLASPLPVVPGERFVLRANVPSPGRHGLSTIGGGRVLGVSNARLRRQRPWTLETLRARREALDNPERWCELTLREARGPVSWDEWQRSSRLRADELRPLAERLRIDGRAVATAAGAFVHRDIVVQAETRMVTAVQAFHQAHPDRAGLSRPALRETLGVPPDLFELAAERALASGQLQAAGAVFAQPGWTAQLAGGDEQLLAHIADAIRRADWMPPAITEVAASLREPAPRVKALVQLLVERAVLVRLDERTLLHHDAVDAAKQVALRLFAQRPAFSTMQFRDALAVSRKFAVPILDHLDRIRFTVRTGNLRTPGVEARKLM